MRKLLLSLLLALAASVTAAVPCTFYGTGSPEGVVTAPVNCKYFRIDSGAGADPWWVKQTGTGNTGWVQASGGGGATGPTGPAGGSWTDADPMVQTVTTRDIQIGAALINSAKCSIDGDADQVQLSIQGHSTQTTPLIIAENSAGADMFTLSNTGAGVFTGSVTGSNLSGTCSGTNTGDDDVPEAGDFGALALTGDVASTGLATTIQANAVALTTDTTGNYAAGDAEAGNALTGDSATAFFSAGFIEVARGGNGAAPGADDQVMVSDSNAAGTYRTLPTGLLHYNAATNTFTAVTLGRSVTLNGTTIDADAELYTQTKCISIDPTNAITNWLWYETEADVTVTKIRCWTDVATSTVAITVTENDVTLNLQNNTEAAITCDADGAADDGAIDDAAIDATDVLRVTRGAVANGPTQVLVCLTVTVND